MNVVTLSRWRFSRPPGSHRRSRGDSSLVVAPRWVALVLSRALTPVLDELLAAVDLERRAGDGRVRHQMEGERRDVGRRRSTRRIGSVARSSSRRSSIRSPRISAASGVSTNPAAIRFTRIGASSYARPFVIAESAAVIAEMNADPGLGVATVDASDEQERSPRANLGRGLPSDPQRQHEVRVQLPTCVVHVETPQAATP